MKRARRSDSSTLQLFPFLAVLVSALGALVLLLLAINRQVSRQATAAAAQALFDRASAEERALAERRLDLEQHLAAIQSEIGTARAEQQSIEQSLVVRDRRLRANTQQSLAVRQELQLVQQARSDLEKKIASIRRQIAEAKDARNRSVQKRRNTGQNFVPIVHPGSQGTARRPIYLECSEQGVMFQPEEVLFPAWLLKSEQGQAAFAHAIQLAVQAGSPPDGAGRIAPGSDPYPLMLVRPDGPAAYYTARRVLESLAMPFGYELVEADWTFQYPPANDKSRAALFAFLDPGSANFASIGRKSGGGFGSPAPAGPGTPQPNSTQNAGMTPDIGRLLGLEPIASSPGGGHRGAMAGANRQGGRSEHPGQQGSSSVSGGTEQSGWSPAGGRAGTGRPEESNGRHGVDMGAGYGGPAAAVSAGPRVESRPGASGEPRLPAASGPSADHLAASRETHAITGPAGAYRPVGSGGDEPVADRGALSDIRQLGPNDRSQAPRAGGAGSHSTNPSEAALVGEELGSLVLPASPGKISIVRHIEIFCRGGTMFIGGRRIDAGDPRGHSRDQMARFVVHEVEKAIAGWGPAGMTFQWQPRLLCLVYPDGLELYYALRLALIGSAIPIDHVLLASDEFDWSGTMFLRELNSAAP